MRCAKRMGCAAAVLAAVVAVGAVEPEEPWGPVQPAELAVVPRGGGVFVEAGWWESCHMMLVSGGRWVPLRRESPPAWGLVRYRPVRALETGVVYQVVAMETRRPDDDAACATVCAEDAAGNRSCADVPAEFTGPGPEQKLATEPLALWLAREVWRLKTGQPDVVGPPPTERMEPARVRGRQIDWWCASAGAAGALVVLMLVAVARGGGYWGWWTRM